MKSKPAISRVLVALVVSLAAPALADAQAVGLGPRLSFVRGDDPGSVDRTRFVGGIVRFRLSKRVVLEGAADFRRQQSTDSLTRIKERPLQGSVLLFPVRSTFSPYALVGYGTYTRTVETFLDDQPGTPVSSSTSERRTGAHFGAGAELFLGRRAAFVADYRYRFVRFGVADEGAGESQVNLPGLGDRLAHSGSMWTAGIAFYF